MLHGFTGSPWDMWPVAEALGQAGVATHVPLLSGHDRGWRAISAVTLADWRRDVTRAAASLHAATGEPVLLAGLSMGGLLSVDLALREEVPIAGVATLAAPLDLGDSARAASSLAGAVRERWGVHLPWPKRGGPDIQNGRPLPGATTIPLVALSEVMTLIADVRAGLSRLAVPLLVLQAQDDHTSPDESPWHLAGATVAAPWVRLVVLDHGFHVVTRDVSRERVAREVTAFAAHLASSSSSPSGSPRPART